MYLNIRFKNFRCFSDVGPVRIAPITILIGENSAGKTSFLAGLREIIEAFSRSTGSIFNREPFFLGSFEQISHYRGGRSGRAKTFTLEVDILPSPNPEQPDLLQSNRRNDRSSTHKFTFRKGNVQPELCKYEVDTRDASATIDLSGTKPEISARRATGEEISLTRTPGASSFLMRREVAYLGFYLQDLSRRVASDGQATISEADRTALRSLGTALRTSSNMMSRSVFASAPVRYQPQRVYTPSELTSQNAGEQVPLQMASIKLSSPDKWQLAKSRLNNFGRKAGLFEDIDIKRFGKDSGDPFQVQVKVAGPTSNIADVGYGISQALPLIFPLQQDDMFNFYLLQQPEVHLHPRAQAEFGSLIASLSSQRPRVNYVIETHSDYILDRIRSEVRDGVTSPDTVSLLLFRRQGLDATILQLTLDAKGDIVDHPGNYREFFLNEQARVLGI